MFWVWVGRALWVAILIGRASLFDQFAMRASRLDGPIVPAPTANAPVKLTLGPGQFARERDLTAIIRGGVEVVVLDPRTAVVRSYSNSAGYSFEYDQTRGAGPKYTLPKAETERLTRLYLRVADPAANDCVVRRIEVDDNQLAEVVVFASPKHQGVPFSWQLVALLKLDPMTGRLLHLAYTRRFAAPATVVPSIEPDAALSHAMEELQRVHGLWAVRPLDTFELCIFRPVAETQGAQDWFTPEQLAEGAAYRGMLVYDGYFGDTQSSMYRGELIHHYRVLLDAMTGRTLALWHLVPLSGGGRYERTTAFAWDLGPGPLTVYCGSWSAPAHGTIERVAPPNVFRADRGVTIRAGDFFLRAEYDARQRLLRTKSRMRYTYGRPSASVVRVLRSVPLPEHRSLGSTRVSAT